MQSENKRQSNDYEHQNENVYMPQNTHRYKAYMRSFECREEEGAYLRSF